MKGEINISKCKFEICDRDIEVAGYCQMHYIRKRKGKLYVSIPDGHHILFLGENKESQLQKPITYEILDSGCWIISSHTKDKDGYGIAQRIINNQKFYRVHRASYAYYNGEILSEELVRHKCNNPSCVNPEHLIKGTHKENMEDRKEAGNYYNAKHPHRKFNESIISEIIKMDEEGKAAKEISAELSININSLRDILKGRTWSHITGRLYNPIPKKADICN